MMKNIVPPFNIMAKPVCGTCNLDCRYCYYTMKPKELYPGVDRFMMSDEVLESYTRQFLEAMPVRCDIGWQGGEPTLAGVEFFKRAIEYQKQYSSPAQTISNALQTNGTLLDDEWCEFLAENNFLVGLSLDGPAQWHDTFRKDHAGNGSFHRAWAGLEKLREHKVEFNVLVTLNSTNAPHVGDIYRYFTNRGVDYLQFIPILERDTEGKVTDFSCTGEQFGKFMLEVFELWSARDIGKVSERFIDNVLHQIIFGKASMCCYSETCANAHVLEYNGDLYACDHFVFKEWLLGNILETPMVELLQSDKLKEFTKLKKPVPSACQDCQYLSFCNGGCPKHHWPISTDPARANHFCQGYKLFFKEALPELTRIAGYIKRNEIPPPKSADGLAPTNQPTAQNQPAAQSNSDTKSTQSPKPSRNAPCPCGSGRKYKSCCGKDQ